MSKVSVIIPCFNLGKYIQEAIDSILIQTFQDFEIIVVNDGSTDAETNLILDNLDKSTIKLIKTDNQGLANARNNGIAEAVGDYILPLDADDKIGNTYLEKAVKILDENQNIGIVYCQAKFFDEENFKWNLPEFQLSRILIDNLIFASAFFRREDWKLVGGYKARMIYGWEDYDLWLSIIELKREVYRIPEYLFYYRQRPDSMANVMTREHFYYSYKEIVKNHKDLYVDNIEYIFEHIYSLRDIILEKQESHSGLLTVHTDLQESHCRLQSDYTNLQNAKNHYKAEFDKTFRQLQIANETIESIIRTKAWKIVNFWWNSKQKAVSWLSQKKPRFAALYETSLHILQTEGSAGLANRIYRFLKGERQNGKINSFDAQCGSPLDKQEIQGGEAIYKQWIQENEPNQPSPELQKTYQQKVK